MQHLTYPDLRSAYIHRSTWPTSYRHTLPYLQYVRLTASTIWVHVQSQWPDPHRLITNILYEPRSVHTT